MLSGGWIPARPGWADARPLGLGSTARTPSRVMRSRTEGRGGTRLRGEDGVEECGGFGAGRAVADLSVAELDDPPWAPRSPGSARTSDDSAPRSRRSGGYSCLRALGLYQSCWLYTSLSRVWKVASGDIRGCRALPYCPWFSEWKGGDPAWRRRAAAT
jgi:hypothetical protein